MYNTRNQFPILNSFVKNNPLIYFDNAASTQKPQVVIDALSNYYASENSNIHRGAHYLANLATEKYEEVRINIANFINAISEEIVFTSGTTQSINILCQAWGRKFLTKDDSIVLSEMEHHANIVPWIVLQKEIGFRIDYIPVNDDCELDLSSIDKIITQNTKLVSVAYISNAMGTIHPIKEIISAAKRNGALIHLDCAQAIQHKSIDVKQLDIDFLSFSSHKFYGPMGVGVFWGKTSILEVMNPYQYGGEMINEVYFNKVTFNKIPFKFEAGTPNVADVIGLGVALEYIKEIGIKNIDLFEKDLQLYLYDQLSKIENCVIYTPRESSTALVSFNIGGIHSYDIGQLLDTKGIAIRTGHHCCQPLMRKLKIEGTCRASLAFYNTKEEIDRFIVCLNTSISLLK